MARQTIKQRIELDGGREIEAELKALGKAGEDAFGKLQAAVNRVEGVGAKFFASMERAQKALQDAGKSFVRVGNDIKQNGQFLTTHLTLPITAAGVSILKLAGDFEASMNAFVANTGAAGTAFEQAKQKAIDLGNASVFTATESADAMTELAKVGLSFEQIMGGAAEATLALAAANGAQLAPAAAVAGDVMKQFNVSAKDLGATVDGISGTLIQSKLDFNGYTLAIGQAGGVAGALGVELEDFNAVLAATASSFHSGSDAGTSFKVFLQRLTPSTDKAVALFEKLNLRFFDAEGNMRSMAEIAEELRLKLGKLSEEDLNSTVSQLFGTDAMRTAIALMKQGGAGVLEFKAAIAKTNAEELAAVRIKGLVGALDQLKSAYETLSIRIGDSGLLKTATDFALKLTDLIKGFSKTSAETLIFGVKIAAVTAIIGPMVVALGYLVSGIGKLLIFFGRTIGAISATILALSRLSVFFLANPWLAAIALVAAGIAVWATRADAATKAMQLHAGVVDEVKFAYRAAGLEVAKMSQEIKDKLLIEARVSLAETEKALVGAIANIRKEIGKFDGSVKKVADPMFDLARQFGDGKLSVEEFTAAIARIGARNSDLATLAKQFLDLSKNALQLSKDATASKDTIDLLTGKITDAEYQTRQMSDVQIEAVKQTKALGTEAQGTATKVAELDTKVQALGKTITVTRFGGEGGPVKEVLNVVDGIVQAVDSSKGKLDELSASADISAEKIKEIGDGLNADIKALPEQLAAQPSAGEALARGLPEATTELQTAGQSGVTAAGEVGSAWQAAGNAALVSLDGVPAKIGEILAAIRAQINAESLVADSDALSAALVKPFADAKAGIEQIIAAIRKLAVSGFSGITSQISAIASSIETMISRIIASLRRAAAAAASLRAQAGGSSGTSGSFASGGHVRGAGSGTSDSIPAWLSNGEFVIKAAAVREFGPAFFAALNGLRMPEFSMGGLASQISGALSVPRFAAGGLVAAPAGSSGRPVNLQFGGQTFAMVAHEDVAAKLVKFANGASLRSAGRKPGWAK